MKLVDILARELKVWPDSASHAVQDNYAHYKGDIFLLDGLQINTDRHDFADGWHLGPGVLVVLSLRAAELAEDHTTAIITREQWQAAVDALNKSTASAWNGEGLPPAGTVCEFSRKGCGNWGRVEILYVGKQRIFFRDRDGDELSRSHGESEFRPIRTAEQIAADEREAGIAGIRQTLISNAKGSIESAIWDAGYRKQVTQ